MSILCQFFCPFAELQVLRGPNHIDTFERLSGKYIRRIPYVPLLLLPCSTHMKDVQELLSCFPRRNIEISCLCNSNWSWFNVLKCHICSKSIFWQNRWFCSGGLLKRSTVHSIENCNSKVLPFHPNPCWIISAVLSTLFCLLLISGHFGPIIFWDVRIQLIRTVNVGIHCIQSVHLRCLAQAFPMNKRVIYMAARRVLHLWPFRLYNIKLNIWESCLGKRHQHELFFSFIHLLLMKMWMMLKWSARDVQKDVGRQLLRHNCPFGHRDGVAHFGALASDPRHWQNDRTWSRFKMYMQPILSRRIWTSAEFQHSNAMAKMIYSTLICIRCDVFILQYFSFLIWYIYARSFCTSQKIPKWPWRICRSHGMSNLQITNSLKDNMQMTTNIFLWYDDLQRNPWSKAVSPIGGVKSQEYFC